MTALLHFPTSIWDEDERNPLHTEYKKNIDYSILCDCRNNFHQNVKEKISKTKWTPFDLMIVTMYYLSYKKLDTFYFLLSMLQKEDASRTFRLKNGEEHTLLTVYCARGAYSDLSFHNVFSSLLRLGCQWNQEVAGGKTALSFLVKSNTQLKRIQWCISEGANLQKGHLLVYASEGMSKEQYENVLAIHIYPNRPDEQLGCWDNEKIFTYLVLNGAPVDDVEALTGMTPLIAACCEDNLNKVRLLVQHGASLYRKNKEGMDAWSWAELHRYKRYHNSGVMHKIYELEDTKVDDGSTVEYPLRDLLRLFEADQKRYWEKVVTEVMTDGKSMLQEVPMSDVLQMVAKV